MKLFNPFSGAEIQLPPVKTLPRIKFIGPEPLDKWCVNKAVFSANPSVEPRPVVLITYRGDHLPGLAFCKPGDQNGLLCSIERHFPWFCVSPTAAVSHKDAIYHNSQFYVLSYPGYISAFDIGRRIDDDDHSVKMTLNAAKRTGICFTDWYLLVLDGELVRFELQKRCFFNCCIDKTMQVMEYQRKRDGDSSNEEYYYFEYGYLKAEAEDEDEKEYPCIDLNLLVNLNLPDTSTYVFMTLQFDKSKRDWVDVQKEYPCIGLNLPELTFGIKIRRFDESKKQWVKVKSLGDEAVFLGYNTSFALSASDYSAGLCIPNSIYFTYGIGGEESTEKFCYDMEYIT